MGVSAIKEENNLKDNFENNFQRYNVLDCIKDHKLEDIRLLQDK